MRCCTAQYRAGRAPRQNPAISRATSDNLISIKTNTRGLYPVNANRATIWGVPCYKDFSSLKDKPDHVWCGAARFAVR